MIKVFILFILFIPSAFAFEQVSLDVALEDFKYDSKHQEFEVKARVELQNKNTDVVEYDLCFVYDYDRGVDDFTEVELAEKSIDFDWDFEHKKIIEILSITNTLEFEQKKENRIYMTKADIKVGPFGIKRRIYSSKHISEFSLEYIPLFHYTDYSTQNEDDNSIYDRHIERSFTQRFDLTLNFSFSNDLITFENYFEWQKIKAIDSRLEDGEDTTFTWKSSLMYSISEQYSIGLEYTVDVDRLRPLQEQPKTARITNMIFNVEF